MILFHGESKNAAFWFAAEEYIMRILRPCEPVIMLWSTDDTIMVGAHQVAEAECDLAYASSAGIEIVRRSSGGGAIFTDKGTVQYTVILPYKEGDDPASVSREWIAAPVIAALDSYSAPASHEGRNDIIIDGKKVSGLAQYISGGYICSHCSILFRTDLEKLTSCLSTDRSKFTTKAITSVRARVANISDYIAEHDISRFCDALVLYAARPGTSLRYEPPQKRAYSITETAQIESIMRDKYLNPEWTFGREPAFTFTNAKRFPGGHIEVFLDVKGGVIQNARINGDFLALLSVSEIETKLMGVPHRAEALAEALRPIDVKAYLGSLDSNDLLEVLL